MFHVTSDVLLLRLRTGPVFILTLAILSHSRQLGAPLTVWENPGVIMCLQLFGV